jgi:hypothetical protein
LLFDGLASPLEAICIFPPCRFLQYHAFSSHIKSIASRRLLAFAFTDSSTVNSRTAVPKRDALSASALHRAALLARLSGFCYYPPDQLAGKLEKEGMKLVTSGTTSFTR